MADDRTLLRDAIRWGRANGWRYDGGGIEKTWEREKDGYVVVGVELADCHHEGCDHDADLNIIDNGVQTSTTASSVQRALDVLVALGVLPARFSSAYAAGQIAACVHVITEPVSSDGSDEPRPIVTERDQTAAGELRTAIDAAQSALDSVSVWPRANGDRVMTEAAVRAAAPFIRRQVAEEIARAIEVAEGNRCPECGGKAASKKWLQTLAEAARPGPWAWEEEPGVQEVLRLSDEELTLGPLADPVMRALDHLWGGALDTANSRDFRIKRSAVRSDGAGVHQ